MNKLISCLLEFAVHSNYVNILCLRRISFWRRGLTISAFSAPASSFLFALQSALRILASILRCLILAFCLIRSRDDWSRGPKPQSQYPQRILLHHSTTATGERTRTAADRHGAHRGPQARG